MVIAKPIQFTMVSDVPLDSSGAFCATSVENIGESAVATNPQKIKKLNKTTTELLIRNKGEQRQHKPDKANAIPAIFFGAICCESNPPHAQDIPPTAIIKKDKSGTLNSTVGC